MAMAWTLDARIIASVMQIYLTLHFLENKSAAGSITVGGYTFISIKATHRVWSGKL